MFRLQKNHLQTIVLLCFFISGMCGLIYEVIWAKMLGLIFGNTTFAVSTILTAFMTGLAAGSLLIGRLIDKGYSPLKTYAWLEIGIGLYALLFSHLLQLKDQLYFLYPPEGDFMTSSLLLFLFCLTILLLPTLLMGGTIPALAKYVTTNFSERGAAIARIYALNTLGAALGSLLAGYFLLLQLGLNGTVYVTAVLNLLIGGTILFCCYRKSRLPPPVITAKPSTPSPNAPPVTPFQRRLLLMAFFISGFTALLYEVCWTRFFALLLGSSVYDFTTMQAAF